ncbi:hypothetical protein [Lentzea sp. NPDC092896]|uniref:hypothetical protein n=1 Tax=Lentzea sp. NPDC092896 TaxID=3364127 RepID=UPI0037FBB948
MTGPLYSRHSNGIAISVMTPETVRPMPMDGRLITSPEAPTSGAIRKSCRTTPPPSQNSSSTVIWGSSSQAPHAPSPTPAAPSANLMPVVALTSRPPAT